jgi:hypothetical protein
VTEFQTRVHVAGQPTGRIQKCARCGVTLIDYRNCAGMGEWLIDYRNSAGIREWSPSWWETGAFIGVTEMADGSKCNPTGYAVLQQDASAIDEIRCDGVPQ